MDVLERMLGATVDVVQQDLGALTVEQLQQQVALAGPVSQRRPATPRWPAPS
jgi:hypothetical protein